MWPGQVTQDRSHHLNWRRSLIILAHMELPAPALFPTLMVQVLEHYFRTLALCHMNHADTPAIGHVKPYSTIPLLWKEDICSVVVALLRIQGRLHGLTAACGKSENDSTAEMSKNENLNRSASAVRLV